MSADNYVIVKRFGKSDFRWATGCASVEEELDDAHFCGPYSTPKEAAEHAQDTCGYIEYGIRFSDDCLVTE